MNRKIGLFMFIRSYFPGFGMVIIFWLGKGHKMYQKMYIINRCTYHIYIWAAEHQSMLFCFFSIVPRFWPIPSYTQMIPNVWFYHVLSMMWNSSMIFDVGIIVFFCLKAAMKLRKNGIMASIRVAIWQHGNVNGHFRILKWRCLPYVRTI